MSSGAENYTTNVFGTKICFLKFHIPLALEILQPDEELSPNLITTMLLANQRHVHQFHFFIIPFFFLIKLQLLSICIGTV